MLKMKPRRKFLQNNSASRHGRRIILPSTAKLSLCTFLVLVLALASRGVHFRDESELSSPVTISTSSWGFPTVLAFQLSSFASSPSLSTTFTTTTKTTTSQIRSKIFSNNNDKEIESSSSNRNSDININTHSQQRLQPNTNTAQPQPQRRVFLKQASALVTTNVVFATAGLSLPFDLTSTAAANALDTTDNKIAAAASAKSGIKVSKNAGGLAQRIRGGVCFKMDELQRDLMQERWDLLQPYPAQLRSYVSIFTTYTDAAFPSDSPSDYGLRVALRYEVGRFFASVERLKRAIPKQSLQEAYLGECSVLS